MKSIPTKYRGYHFRSRLEARWAVFFDHLGLRWEYEPEGFDLGPEGCYLPDFKVYGGRETAWFEVKAVNDTFDKAVAFARNINMPVGLLDGPPDYKAYRFLMTVEEGRLYDDAIVFTDPAMKYSSWYWAYGEFNPGWSLPSWMPDITSKVREAVAAARSARFEHGQAGATL